MKQHVRKWGNSDAVRIPAPLLAAAGLKIGDPVYLQAENGRIIIEKSAIDHPTLDELIAGITPENRHEPFDWGPPVGKEIW